MATDYEIKFSAEVLESKRSKFASRYSISKHAELNEEYLALQQNLLRTASLCEDSNERRISVQVSNQKLLLADAFSLDSWFKELVDNARNDIIAMLRRDFGISLPGSFSFTQEIEGGLPLDIQLLKRAADIKAFHRAKGFLWEWLILCALLIGSPSQGNSAEDLTFRDNPNRGTEILIGNRTRWMWYQKRIKRTVSGFSAKPDFLITRNSEAPDEYNTLGFIECKHHASLTSRLVREIYGTALDLKVSYALIAHSSEVKRTHISNARRLGVTIMQSPLYGLQREEYLERKLMADNSIRSAVEQAAIEAPFEKQEHRRYNDYISKDRG